MKRRERGHRPKNTPSALRLGFPVILGLIIVGLQTFPSIGADPDPPPELDQHVVDIAKLAQESPMTTIPEGWFLMGTNRKDDDPFGLETQFDNTEFPQQRIWLDAFAIDRDEVSLGEYLAFMSQPPRHPPEELRRLIWHLISVHALPDL